MHKFLAVAASVVLLTGLGEPAHAFTYTEGADLTAAPLVPDAVEITPTNATADGNPNLTNLTGSASGTAADAIPEADLFGIFLTGGTTFTATPVQAIQPGSTTASDYNIQLFLFNANESGVAAVDGGTNGSPELAPLSYVVPTSGVYYLGISGYDFDPTATPVNGNSFIFPNTNQPVNNNPLNGWAEYTGTRQVGAVEASAINYDINLTNARPVPEPAVGGSLLVVAGLGALSARRRAKQAQKA